MTYLQTFLLHRHSGRVMNGSNPTVFDGRPNSVFRVARLDSELVGLARGASAVRLAVGAALDTLASSGGYHELGFSSLEAYARERCERTGRWARARWSRTAPLRKAKLVPQPEGSRAKR
jgi:hypothetical protein